MNFYATSVALLWTTAMRVGQLSNPSHQRPPAVDGELGQPDATVPCERIRFPGSAPSCLCSGLARLIAK